MRILLLPGSFTIRQTNEQYRRLPVKTQSYSDWVFNWVPNGSSSSTACQTMNECQCMSSWWPKESEQVLVALVKGNFVFELAQSLFIIHLGTSTCQILRPRGKMVVGYCCRWSWAADVLLGKRLLNVMHAVVLRLRGSWSASRRACCYL